MTIENQSITATSANGNDYLSAGEGDDTLSGLGGNDTLIGLLGNDSLDGGADQDVLEGGDGDDTLIGGAGDDTLTGGAGVDLLYGGEGNDTLYDTGVSSLFGEGGDDVLTVASVEDGGRTYGLWMDGGDGNDLIAAPTLYRAYGGAGDDVIQMSAMQPTAPDLIDGGEGYDELRFSWYGWGGLNIDFSKVLNFELINISGDNGGGLRAVLSDVTAVAGMTMVVRASAGGHGINVDGSAETDAYLQITGVDSYSPNDTLTGGQLADTISGLGGNDVLSGQAGDDWLLGGAGDDTLTGGQGNDTLDGGDGLDTAVFSGNYADYVITEVASTEAAAGYLEVNGVEGTDRLYGINQLRFADQNATVIVPGLLYVGTEESDAGRGGEGDDTLSGLGGNDTLIGLLGNDSLDGGADQDILEGGDGDDTLIGGAGGDTLTGGAGVDLLYGGEGNDTLYDTGVSSLFGEGGDDVLTVASVEDGGRTYGLWMDGGDGNDLIAAPTLYRAYGGAGDDVIQMSAMQPTAPDLIDGGEGTDELRLSWYGWSGLNIDFSKVLNVELINFTDGNGGGLRAVLSDVTAVAGMTLQIRTSGSGHGIHVDGSAELDAHLDMRGVDSYSPNDTLIGGQLSDTINGLGGNDVLSGQAGDDWLLGGAGDDTLTGGQGNDTLDGGDGLDTAVFSGNHADYVVTEIVSTASAAGYLEVSGAEGTDRLYGINRLLFADQTVDVTVPGLLLVGTAEGEALLAGEGDDTVQGLEGADTLTGLLGHDSLLGGEGDDVLGGGDGDDTLLGGEGGDTLTGGAGLDLLYGGEGRDTLYDTGVSWLFGEGGDDVLTVTSVEGGGRTYGLWMDGGEGNDLIAAPTLYRAYGGAGDDVIQMSAMQPTAPDLIDGGEGTDELRLSWYGWSGLNIDFSKVLNVELINFTDGNGGGLRAVLSDVTAVAGMTLQIRTSGSGHGILVDGSAELDAHLDMRGVDSYSPNDTLIGGQLSDTINGLGGNDVLNGQAGDDWLLGGAGDDTLTGGQGNDTLDGGDGLDTAVFSGNYADYVINEGIGSSTIVGADGSDVLRNMNRLVFADQIVDLVIAGMYLEGTEASDSLVGSDGDDAIAGLGGDDSILGGDGNDVLDGGLGNDSLYAGTGDDSVDAGDGDDLIVGGDGAGDDTYVGGEGIDTVRYTSAVTGIVVDLSAGTARGNEIGADQLQGIENIIGGQAADRLIGRHDANAMDGYWGDDTIVGGGGADLLTGGTGKDVFLLQSVVESIFNPDVRSYDTITDLSDGDQIQWLGMAGLSTTMRAYAWSTDLASTIAAVRSDRDTSNQVIFFTDQTDGYFYIHGVGAGNDFDGSLVKLSGVRSVPESMTIPGVTVISPEVIQQGQDSVGVVNHKAPTVMPQQPRAFSGDPSLGLRYEIMDHTPNAVVFGTDSNDFIYLGGTGNKAVNGGGGHDVIDGGTGSSFMTGGGSGDSDTFFLDGRASGITWSTITDFEMGLDRVTIWGWKEGVSRVALIDEQGGAAGFSGLTLHFENLLPDQSEVGATNVNLNSITFSKLGLEDFGIESLDQINQQISEKINSHFIVGQTTDVYGEHGYLHIS